MNSVSEFTSLAGRYQPGRFTASTLGAPKSLSWENIYEPHVEGHFFTKQQIETSFPKIARAFDKVVQIGAGSGFLLSNSGILLTDEHVLDSIFYSNSSLKVQNLLLGGQQISSLQNTNVLYKSKEDDFAALHIPSMIGRGCLEFNLYPEDHLNDVVFLIGNPNSFMGNKINQVEQVVSVGQLLSYDGKVCKARILATNGNSGGPLLNRRGECLGFIQQHSEESQLVQECLSIKYVLEKLSTSS
jgi:S1-C subfamily serine protease